MDTPEATASLDDYITRPPSSLGRHMVGISTATHDRISELAVEHNTSNGKIVTALLAFYDDEDV